MAEDPGMKLRWELDTFVAKALLTLNGGGIVVLLTFVSTLMNNVEYQYFVVAVFIGIILFVAGLVSAVQHTNCRRECERRWELWRKDELPENPMTSKPCVNSKRWRAWSFALFLVGAILIALMGIISSLPGTPLSINDKSQICTAVGERDLRSRVYQFHRDGSAGDGTTSFPSPTRS